MTDMLDGEAIRAAFTELRETCDPRGFPTLDVLERLCLAQYETCEAIREVFGSGRVEPDWSRRNEGSLRA